MYELCRVVRAFDPSFAKDNLDAAFVDTPALPGAAAS